MIKIRYFSDLHLEFRQSYEIDNLICNIPSGLEEICVLAGDIGNPYHENYDIFMNFISENFKKSFVIAGNHEYYNKKTIEETNNFLSKYFEQFDNITFLNNSYEYYNVDDYKYCFIGTTLWSKITNPHVSINDTRYIQNLDYIKYNQLHSISKEFLEHAINNNNNCIIITHHGPSEYLIDIKYKTPNSLPYNQWFYSNMDYLFDKEKIKCWFYGHTHTPSNNIINGIPFLCNPIGYPNENINIDLSKNIDMEVD